MVCCLLVSCDIAAGLELSNKISPWNSDRPSRPVTSFIILHTTEGPNEGSLRKIYNNGEAHFFVDTDGSVTRIIQENKIQTKSDFFDLI